MALDDPQTVTIDSVARVLNRTGFGENSGTFKSNDGLTTLSVASQYGRRVRRTIRIDDAKVAPDPLISAQNVKYSMSSYIVFDMPLTGYTVAEAKLIVDGFLAHLAASSGAIITEILGGEN